jgi:hypothetical protein
MGGIELLAVVITALLGALPPLVKAALEALVKASPRLFDSSVGKVILRISGAKSPTTSTGTKDLLLDLRKAAIEMDRIVDEIGHYTEERQSTVIKLENDLHTLSQREQELKERIEGLEKVPLPAAEYFAKLVEKTEKRSATRDYSLFLLGVVLSGVVVVILKAFGLG